MHADKHKGHARPSSTLLSVQWKLWELQYFSTLWFFSCKFCSGHALHGLDRSCQIKACFVYIAATTAEIHLRCLALLIHKMATQRKHCFKRWWRGACLRDVSPVAALRAAGVCWRQIRDERLQRTPPVALNAQHKLQFARGELLRRGGGESGVGGISQQHSSQGSRQNAL